MSSATVRMHCASIDTPWVSGCPECAALLDQMIKQGARAVWDTATHFSQAHHVNLVMA